MDLPYSSDLLGGWEQGDSVPKWELGGSSALFVG